MSWLTRIHRWLHFTFRIRPRFEDNQLCEQKHLLHGWECWFLYDHDGPHEWQDDAWRRAR